MCRFAVIKSVLSQAIIIILIWCGKITAHFHKYIYVRPVLFLLLIFVAHESHSAATVRWPRSPQAMHAFDSSFPENKKILCARSRERKIKQTTPYNIHECVHALASLLLRCCAHITLHSALVAHFRANVYIAPSQYSKNDKMNENVYIYI